MHQMTIDEILERPPGEEGDDQEAAEGEDAPVVEEDDLEDAEEQDDPSEPDE